MGNQTHKHCLDYKETSFESCCLGSGCAPFYTAWHVRRVSISIAPMLRLYLVSASVRQQCLEWLLYKAGELNVTVDSLLALTFILWPLHDAIEKCTDLLCAHHKLLTTYADILDC